MIGFVSLHCLSINPFIHTSILAVYMAQKTTALHAVPVRRDFLYYCRTGYVVSTVVYVQTGILKHFLKNEVIVGMAMSVPYK